VLIIVINNTSTVLERVETENRHGLWRQLPPEKIDKNTTVKFGTESTGIKMSLTLNLSSLYSIFFHVGLAGTEGKVLFVAPSTEEEDGGN